MRIITTDADHGAGAPLLRFPTARTAPPGAQASPGCSMLTSATPPVSGTARCGEPVMHPGVNLPQLADLVDPEQELWTPPQLRDLAWTVAAELAAPLLEVARFVPGRRWRARLALTGGVELWLLSWTPGQDSGPHDHGGACGSFAVLAGELTEDYTVDYRHPAGPSRCALRRPGAAVGFGPNRAHRLRNLDTHDAASVHACSPPRLPVRTYASLANGPTGANPQPTGQGVR